MVCDNNNWTLYNGHKIEIVSSDLVLDTVGIFSCSVNDNSVIDAYYVRRWAKQFRDE